MEERNIRPNETSKMPLITLAVLVAFILALLFIGYEYFSDGPTADIKRITEQQNSEANDLQASTLPAESEPTTTETEKPKSKPKETKAEEKEKEKEKPAAKEKQIDIPEGGKTIPHVVASGETFFGIANRYNLKTDVLKALNPDINPQTIGAGTKLKVKIKAKHTIGPGDILSVVAKKYSVSKEAIMAANKLERDFAKRGDELIIPLGK
jgi:LysM repeat protein